MDNAYIGAIMIFAGNFAPRGWALCNGQVLSIAQNTALFSILGTTYGGNGQTTFALPDLRGRVAVSQGQGPGLTNYVLGEVTGTENVSLLITEMPAHNHAATTAINVSARADQEAIVDAVLGQVTGTNLFAARPDGTSLMNPGMVTVTVGVAGGSQPHNNIQPLLAINYIICTEGLFPSRN